MPPKSKFLNVYYSLGAKGPKFLFRCTPLTDGCKRLVSSFIAFMLAKNNYIALCNMLFISSLDLGNTFLNTFNDFY